MRGAEDEPGRGMRIAVCYAICVGPAAHTRRRSTLPASIARLALLFAAAAAVACAPAPAPPSRPNIVLILLDTVRRDHLGIYGYERDTTPTIDALGRSGLVFDNAIAQSSWTLPSFASLMTSRYASELLPSVGETAAPAGRLHTLTESLDRAGYETISVATNPYNAPFFGLMEGFDRRVYETSAGAAWVVDRAIEAIDDAPAPFFLFLHFMDGHYPLTVPPPYDAIFPTLDGAPHAARMRTRLEFGDPDGVGSREFQIYRSHTLALYDGALRFMDAEIGRLLERLKALGLYENCVIAIAADHGQEFWDHGSLARALGLEHFRRRGVYGLGHGHTLFPELTRVPLIFHGVGIPRERIAAQVRNVDIAPTLLALANVDAPELSMRGVDLLSLISTGALSDLPAFSETESQSAAQRALFDGRYQYLRLDERELLFDLASDDLVDIAATHPEVVSRLRTELDRKLAGIEVPEAGPETPGPEIRNDLEALGYIE